MKKDSPEEVMLQVKLFLKNNGLKQQDFASTLGYKSPQTASNILNSDKYFTAKQAEILCAKYEFYYDYLTSGIGGLMAYPDEKMPPMPSERLNGEAKSLFLQYVEEVFYKSMMFSRNETLMEICNKLENLSCSLKVADSAGKKTMDAIYNCPDVYIAVYDEEEIYPLLKKLSDSKQK